MTDIPHDVIQAEVSPGRSVDDRFAHKVVMTVPVRHNPKLRRLMEDVNADDDLYGLWLVANVNAMERLGMTDHGPVHVKIVMNLAVRMLRLLVDAGVPPSVVTDYEMEPEDAEIVVALGALLHDLGMSIHRADHEAFSLFVAQDKLRQLLPRLYDERRATILRAEILHAIISHRSGGKPLTLEAGVVRIADALDMAKGRSRIPFERGSVSIHSLSAAAVEDVLIKDGDERPIRIEILMNNSSGIYQVDGLLKAKLRGSGLEPYVEVIAHIDTEAEKRLVPVYRLET